MDALSFSVGFLILPTSFGPGTVAGSQPSGAAAASAVGSGVAVSVAAVVASGVAVLSGSGESLPHAAKTRARLAMRTARSRCTAGKDNAARVNLSPAVRSYDHVLLDLDGCLWLGEEPIEGASDAVTALREAGKSILFLTNDVRNAPEGFVSKLWRLGFRASLDEVLSVGAAVQFVLAGRNGGRGNAFVVGSQALVDHVAEAGWRIVNHTEFATRADIVVVAAYDELIYDELRIATQAVLRGAELIGATRDASFPMPDGMWPGTGAVLAAIETATGVEAARDHRQARGPDVRRRPRPPRPGPHPRRRRPPRDRHRGRPPRGHRPGARPHRRHHPRRGRGHRPPPHPHRRLARDLVD